MSEASEGLDNRLLRGLIWPDTHSWIGLIGHHPRLRQQLTDAADMRLIAWVGVTAGISIGMDVQMLALVVMTHFSARWALPDDSPVVLDFGVHD